MKRERGFTLIELIFTVALISIMIGIAVPSFRTFISNYRATSATNDLLQGITLTRAEALKRGRKVTLSPIGGDWANGWTIFIDTGVATPPVWASPEELIFTHSLLPTTVSVTGPNGTGTPFGGNYVAFDGTGYPRSTVGGILSGGVQIKDSMTTPNNIRTVCLSLLGRPRVITGAADCSSG